MQVFSPRRSPADSSSIGCTGTATRNSGPLRRLRKLPHAGKVNATVGGMGRSFGKCTSGRWRTGIVRDPELNLSHARILTNVIGRNDIFTTFLRAEIPDNKSLRGMNLPSLHRPRQRYKLFVGSMRPPCSWSRKIMVFAGNLRAAPLPQPLRIRLTQLLAFETD